MGTTKNALHQGSKVMLLKTGLVYSNKTPIIINNKIIKYSGWFCQKKGNPENVQYRQWSEGSSARKRRCSFLQLDSSGYLCWRIGISKGCLQAFFPRKLIENFSMRRLQCISRKYNAMYNESMKIKYK